MSRRKWAASAMAWAGPTALACCGDPEGRIVIGGNSEQDAAAAPPVELPPIPPNELPPDSSFPEPELLLCLETDCVAPFGTCPTSRWACQTNLDSDAKNCGTCGSECPQNPNAGSDLNMAFSCVEGQCRAACINDVDFIFVRRFANCNAILEDGCEVSLGTPQNCSQCGDACGAGLVCNNFQCGCPAGFLRQGDTCVCPQGATECSGRCVDLTGTDANCGTCDTACTYAAGPVPNTHLGCVSSTCNSPKCNDGYLDCDLQSDNGCEVAANTDAANCGACGNACAAGKQCFRGECVCDAGTFCSGACVDLTLDATNCGSCNNTCPGLTARDAAFFSQPPPNGAPACTGGSCDYTCEPGWADCDEDIQNGCETDIQTNPLRCGSCNTECDLRGGQICSRGECALRACEPGEVR